MKRSFEKMGLMVMPKRTLTHVVGALARHPISRHFIPLYIRHYKINTDEASKPVHAYGNLTEFFVRQLKKDARPLTAQGVSSPVDGTVSELGIIDRGTLLQAKGSTYSLAALLADEQLAREFEGGTFVTIYLSPRDYHRIHMPIDGKIVAWKYVPGALYPVNRAGVAHIKGLFARNERMVNLCETSYGRMALVKVGATIVGSIRTEYGPEYAKPFQTKRRSIAQGVTNLSKSRGDEVGRFEFGSTVILIFERGVIQRLTVSTGQSVQMGEEIAELTADNE